MLFSFFYSHCELNGLAFITATQLEACARVWEWGDCLTVIGLSDKDNWELSAGGDNKTEYFPKSVERKPRIRDIESSFSVESNQSLENDYL